MAEALRPLMGGFFRPFGCGWFIREFLLGNAPEGTPKIDPDEGAVTADIFYHYKVAIHRAYAEDATAWEQEQRIKRLGKEGAYTPEEYAERVDWHFRRIPYKLVKARYHSFSRYFHWLKQLEWVERTGVEEKSTIQSYLEDAGKPPDAPPRIFYRLSRKGIAAPTEQWSRPQLVLYPLIAGENAEDYFRRKRRERKYVKKAPTKRRVRSAT